MKKPLTFKINTRLEGKLGRTGVISTPHGDIKTPCFVPVGTKATMKAVLPEQLKELGAQVMLSNTYHLYLQPNDEVIKKAGGLHKFMNWPGPVMTDSGGFQVFSLGAAFGKGIGKVTREKNRELLLNEAEEEIEKPKIAHIDADGVMFRSHISGDAHYFTPEKSIQIQHNLGADIIIAFDECTSPLESDHYQIEALDRTHRWAKRCLEYHQSTPNAETQALFGIVQGGRSEKLRKESAKVISSMDFDGFGIGGSFAKEDMTTAVQWVNEVLPENKPRHLLGIGEPEDLFMGAENGVDLFDCVAPTRIGRNGGVYTKKGKIILTNAQYTEDFTPIDEGCECYTCKHYGKGYLNHLFKAKEMLAGTLASIHNLYFIVHLVDRIRESMEQGNFYSFKKEFLDEYLSEK